MGKRTQAIAKCLSAVYQNLRIIDSYDIRRYLAIVFMTLGSVVLSIMLACIIYLLSNFAGYLFTIAIGLLILIGLIQTGFVALLAKREIEISKEKVIIKDSDSK